MNTRSKVWLAIVFGGLGAFITATLVLPRSFQLTTAADLTEAALLISGAASFIPLAVRSKGRLRLFWSLLIFGFSLWLLYQLFWTWYEVFLRREVPDLFAGDAILFLHIVPLMAALALRPHVRKDEYAARVGHLDFALLLVWWFYLYGLVVLPWQYAVSDVAVYNRNLNALYLAEKLALLVLLAASWVGSQGPWRKLYLNLLGMSLTYSAGSVLANWAIARGVYYSGSIYDVPLACAMAWLTWIGLRTSADEPETDSREVSTVYGVWIARCGMIAVFTLPLFAAWSITDSTLPSPVRVFRLVITLFAALVMGVMAFLRQYLLDRELGQLLHYSRQAFDKLKRLQAHVLQSEKKASIGQLVGGAAHELNNPITAMLGYSDLLLSTQLTPRQRALVSRIGQDVRRTRFLVASLISFARQAPAPKRPLDLNTLARTAVKLSQEQWESLGIDVQTNFDPELPRVLGDSNQLLQVCLHLLSHCFNPMEAIGKFLMVRTTRQGQNSLLLIAIGPAPLQAEEHVASEGKLPDALGISACQGILQEHGGTVSVQRGARGELLVRVELPSYEPATAKERDSTVPVLWQSRPFA